MKKIDFNTKNKLISLAGACFWYWNNFYSFLESCGIPSSIYLQFGKENKYQVMRSILEFLERQGKYELIQNIAVEFYNFTPSEKEIDEEKANGLLDEFRKSMGNSLIDNKLEQQNLKSQIEANKRIIEERENVKQKLGVLKNDFMGLQATPDKQHRGYALEKIFFDLLGLEEFEHKLPYKTSGEQIDGHFNYEKFDYLVELKWTEGQCKQKDLSIFEGKINSKAQSTRGLFLSVNGFDENCIAKNSGDAPRVIFADGKDLFCVLDDRISFFDLMKLKVDQLVRMGKIYVSYSGNE